MESLRWLGPEQFRFDELIRQALSAGKDHKRIFSDRDALFYWIYTRYKAGPLTWDS